jgi:hypothetical protein
MITVVFFHYSACRMVLTIMNCMTLAVLYTVIYERETSAEQNEVSESESSEKNEVFDSEPATSEDYEGDRYQQSRQPELSYIEEYMTNYIEGHILPRALVRRLERFTWIKSTTGDLMEVAMAVMKEFENEKVLNDLKMEAEAHDIIEHVFVIFREHERITSDGPT